MAFEETREQQQMYNLFRTCIYLFLVFEFIMLIPIHFEGMFFEIFHKVISAFKIFNSLVGCKVAEFVLLFITCIGTKARKDENFNLKKMVLFPIVLGLGLTGLCFVFYGIYGQFRGDGAAPVFMCLYIVCSIMGVVFCHQGGDAIAKYFNSKVGDDRFNFENESFQQSTQRIANEYSVNIPMIFYFNKRLNHGWINVTNPFRGTIVLGTPGSGKSFGIIDPFIRQHASKGFAMMVYDYKFPTLARNLFFQYCKNIKNNTLPNNCGFKIINFSDVEYSHRINPIQKKYIPDLAAASETAATLLAALNKGGGEKKGGSEAFFTNSAENFLAAIMYFFVNFRPTGWKNGNKLKQYIYANGMKLRIKFRGWSLVEAVDENNNIILDFFDHEEKCVAFADDGVMENLDGFSYMDCNGDLIQIQRVWYEDENGIEVEPDTITGEFSDMAHVLAFLGRSYSEVFDILMKDAKISSLMAPFKSAYDAKANDQLEGMVGTLRVNSARLVSPEAFWVFTGDDFDLKISDKESPSYLVIANDPEKEQVIGSLNALVLNRLIARVNSKGNIPVSIIVDELPTLYFHKIDRLIGTARSNKVAVTLGFQELPQLEADYGKVGMHKILSTCGNIFMGAARNKETLEWAQNDVFGKVKQISKSVTISDRSPSYQFSEKMDNLVPAAKIADMATGWLAGQAARDFSPTDKKMFDEFDIEESEDFKTTKYFCKTDFDMGAIKREENAYVDLPKIYSFESERSKEYTLNKNFMKVNQDIEDMINSILHPEL